METVNIPRDHIDPHFRYKRQVVKIEARAKGKGTTIILNILSIANSLYRTPHDISSFLKKRIGANTRIEDGKLIIPGKYDIGELEDYIEEYIEKDILCPSCGLPETRKVRSDSLYNGSTNLTCYACHFSS